MGSGESPWRVEGRRFLVCWALGVAGLAVVAPPASENRLWIGEPARVYIVRGSFSTSSATLADVTKELDELVDAREMGEAFGEPAAKLIPRITRYEVGEEDYVLVRSRHARPEVLDFGWMGSIVVGMFPGVALFLAYTLGETNLRARQNEKRRERRLRATAAE